jgi:hypothetical protein
MLASLLEVTWLEIGIPFICLAMIWQYYGISTMIRWSGQMVQILPIFDSQSSFETARLIKATRAGR